MRYVLTIIAVALVVALSTALVAPFFIDWTAHRAQVEARLSAMTGASVALTGPIAVRLLPTPYLALGEGSVSAPGPDAAQLSFASARLELALVKLAGGAIRFADIQLEKPVLTISRGDDGALSLPALPSGRAETIGFDRLVVIDGQARIVSRASRAVREIAGVQLDATASSLDGPYRVSGQVSGPNGAPVVFHFASEKAGPSETPVRLSVDAGQNWPALEFDGALKSAAASGAKGLSLVGSATLVGTVAGDEGLTPWRAVGRMTADLDRAAIEEVEFRLGPDERALAARGSAALTFGSPARLGLALRAKQANVDSLLRRKGEDGVAPARALAFLSRAVEPALEGSAEPMTIDADLSAESIVLGAQTLSDAAATIRAGPGAPLHARFDLGLPGRSRLRGEGDLETGAAAKFRGAIDFNSGDIALLRNWASLGAPDFAAKAGALGETLAYRGASLSGDIEASAVGFSGRNLKIGLDRSTLTGSLAITGPVGANPGRLYMDLSSDSLDVEALPNLKASAALIGDLDLSLSLQANSLHIAHVGEAAIDSGSMVLKATKSGPDVSVDRLSVADLGGASLDAQGAIGPEGIVATGHLRADRLRDFALLVARLAPGDWSRTLAERAAALSPASLAFEAGGHGGSVDAPGLDSLKVNGTIGRTQVALALGPGPRDSGQALTLGLDSPDTAAFLHQVGLGRPTASSGPAHVALHASGGWTAGYDVDATGAVAGADLTWRGRFFPDARGDEARFFGSVRLHSENVASLIAALGLARAGGGALGPADAGGEVTLRGDRWTGSRIAATVAGIKASGDLSYQPATSLEAATIVNPDVARAQSAIEGPAATARPREPPTAEITGELSVERLPLAGLLAIVLGPPQRVRAGARWSEAKFLAPTLSPPSTAVRLKAGTLDIADGVPAQGFTTTLRLDGGRLDLDEIGMKVAGGAVSGHATLRRDNDNATVTGTLAANSLEISRAGFSARVGGTLEFASTGGSAAALIEGLAGGGTAQLAGAALARSDPTALDRVIAKAQTPDALLDETNIAYALGNELNKGPLPIPDGSAPVALSAGALKFGPLAITRLHGDASLSGSLDLRKLAFETRLAITSPASDLKFWSGPPPSATVEVQDAPEGPKRQLDVSALSAGLATQAIARESDRIAALEADIRERAFFNRRLKGERFMDRRAAEIEDWRVEQARLKGLAEHLQAERQAAEKAAAEKAAAEKAAAEKAAAERAAAEKAAAEKAAAEKAAAEKAAAAKALAEKAAMEKAAADRAAAEKAAADKAAGEILGLPLEGGPAVQTPGASGADELGANAPPPPVRPKPRAAPADPTQSGLY